MITKRRITCADLKMLYGYKHGRCLATAKKPGNFLPLSNVLIVDGETFELRRCIDVPANECRMKPIDVVTGKPVKRKFVVPKEGVEAKWWKEVKETDKHGKALLLQKDRKATRKRLSKRSSL